MPEAVLTTAGKRYLLGYLFVADWVDTPGNEWALFTNNYTPTPDSVWGDFDRSGIAPNILEMTNSEWQDPELVSGVWRTYWGEDATEFAAIGGAVTVYGYVVREVANLDVMWAQKFDAPVALSNGQVIRVWPYFEFNQCP